ncbi:MAG: mannose-6-phosphate isomerase, class I [Desulfobacteraceae bacterium]|nr:mannose-6-phosphate isomerase, class I [Desulfobacteraceae bacterium]
MNKISFLKNPVQEYAWGSRTAIQTLLGEPVPSARPAAELWMGAHPKSPSEVLVDGEWQSLEAVIGSNPRSILGEGVAREFSNKLPFLFKVLAADQPLSIQVHPNLEQARAGFERENSLGIPLDAPYRNYRDPNHKPEILCALTSFQGLKGFRRIPEALALMEKVSRSVLSAHLARLGHEPTASGLEEFFSSLMRMDRERQGLAVTEAASIAEKYVDEDRAFFWMVELNRQYPGDVGVFSPLFLNLVKLEPGGAIFLPAGELHAYLQGVGIELMANSDNVLRGGLTPKHIDVPELLKIVDFRAGSAQEVESTGDGPCHRKYVTPTREFLLSVISLDEGECFESSQDRNVEILICVSGGAGVTDLRSREAFDLSKGKSVVIPSAVSGYTLEGNATLYKASVPMG